MTVTAVHQITAGMAPRDAISQHVLAARRLLRSWGYVSEIYSDNIHPAVASEVRNSGDLPRSMGGETLLIVHYSIDSPVFRAAACSGARLAMHYHNITPAHLLWRFAPDVARQCALGRRRLPSLADRVEVAWADSAFNADELAEAGYRDPVPLGIIRSELPVTERAERPGTDIRLLFVGRGIPNKAQHDLVFALGALREVGVSATLTLVGDWGSAPAYHAFCLDIAKRLGVDDDLEIAGSVNDRTLAAAYRDADIFLCLSDHEGFCVPLLEAMAAGLPIVAYAAGAVPETVGDAALLLRDKTPSIVAEAIMAVREAPSLGGRMADARPARLAALDGAAVAARMRAAVEAIT